MTVSDCAPRIETPTRDRTRSRSVANGSKRLRITISLSEKSYEAFNEIKAATDADTDSEVFRNALRLHLMLLRAHQNGARLFMKRDGVEESIPVTLFVDDE
ncbi:MAG: ribbon-helix-helix protein, CopG family [Pseudomonadota bacterium]